MTPHVSPSVSLSDLRPAKRPRLSKSTLRVLSVWDQLAERYNKRLDEDDIVDLYSGTIINDRGVLKSAERDYSIGHFAHDDSQDDQTQDQADSGQEQDDDADELDTLPAQNSSGTNTTMASTSELLHAVPPLSATTDADDLNEFLQAERRRRELLGDQDGEGEMSMEELDALREALRQQEDEEQPGNQEQPGDAEQSEIVAEDESEDELSLWQHEASAVYHIACKESQQDVAEGEQKINELTDSDEEFATLLERPPRVLKRKRLSSSSSQRPTSSGSTLAPDTPPTPTSTRFASRISSKAASVLGTPLATPNTRFASYTPQTPVPTFPLHSADLDPTQSPQHLLYQAMQHLSYALSALSYSSPPIAPWGDAGFAHPWGPRTTLDDDTTLVDDDSTPEVDNDDGVVENDRRRIRSPIGPKNKIEYQKGIQSGRSHHIQEDKQGKRIVAMRQRYESPLDAKSLVARAKKKGNVKNK